MDPVPPAPAQTAPQPQPITLPETPKSKIWLWVLGGILLLAAGTTGGIFLGRQIYSKPASQPIPSPVPVNLECKADSDCPTNYICEAIQSTDTACSSNDPNCKPTSTITRGVCKLKVGGKCSSDKQCQPGLLCHADICTNPIGRQCSGSSDTSCPSGYQCIQSCGPPVAREGDPPPPYYCKLNEYAAKPSVCPICLAANTLIDTPSGSVAVKDLQIGMPIWTIDKAGHRVSGVVTKTSKVPVPPTHQMVHLVLDDGRELFVSPGHPTIDGSSVGDLTLGELYDGASVVNVQRVPYGDNATYDVLPSGETGFYRANGVLLGSTLKFLE